MSTTTRKRCRSGERCIPQNLKEALDCLGHHSERTIHEIAERIGRPEATVAKECSRWDDYHWPTIRQVVPLTMASENDSLIEYLCRAVGGVFVRLDAPACTRPEDLNPHVARMVREFGELLEGTAGAAADAVLTSDEVANVSLEADQVIAAIVQLKAHLAGHVAPAADPSTNGLRRVV